MPVGYLDKGKNEESAAGTKSYIKKQSNNVCIILTEMKRILTFVFILIFSIGGVSAQNYNSSDRCEGPKGCKIPHPNPPHHQDPLDDTSTSGGISADPNEIIGPMGYDSIHWVSVKDVLNYTILFENDPEFATANAQKVDVRFTFEDKAQMKGFGLGTYGFANMSWDIEKNPAAYQNRLDLRDSMFIYVDLTAGIDVVKQQAFWTFSSIDPETGLNPWQVDRGMLPVNDSTHVGEGFVKFQLIPNEALQTGDTISIAANIVFDQNDTIPTNRWRVTIDAGAPTSKVKGKKDSKNENLYHLTVQAADDENGSGLKRVVLYQANNFGIYEEYAVCPLDTVIDFKAEPGRQYRFYTLAEDNVGNLEPLKEEADLVINVNAAPTDIALSDSIFQDDIAQGGFIAELTSEDIETESTFTYALAEGEGAIHNEMFQISGTQLQAKDCFKCAEDSIFKIRLSTTDEGGLSFSKAFELNLKKVLIKPDVDTLNVCICEGDVYDFFGKECGKAGTYRYEKSNEFMCDSVYVLNLSMLPRTEKPLVTVEGTHTLVSSADKGNQWFREDGTMVVGENGQKFTPTTDGVYYVAVSNGSCFSEPSQFYRVFLSTATDLNLNLAKGWNWVSSNLSETEMQDALSFLKPIEKVTERLVGQTTELYNDPKLGLVGGLKSINPSDGYKLLVTEPTQNSWSGNGCRADNTPIQLHKGWNWIGYVPISSSDISEALAGLEPSENDVLKTLDAFATYSGGKWTGTLEKMEQGVGYMYFSGKNISFKYPLKNVFSVVAEPAMSVRVTSAAPWHYNPNSYPDNKTIIAEVHDESGKVLQGVYSVGAFVGNECRGMGTYVDGLLYITIHGTVAYNETITFKAYENATARELSINETLSLDGVHTGTPSSPYLLHLSSTTAIKNAEKISLNIYPNPVRYTMYINGNTECIKDIKIFTSNGHEVLYSNGYNDAGIDVSSIIAGIYVVALHTDMGYQYEKIIIQK